MKVVITARNFEFEGCTATALLQENGFDALDFSDRDARDGEAFLQALREADAVINGFEPMDAALLSQCKKLRLISVRGVGYDYLDLSACAAQNIAIARTVGCVGDSVAEQAMASILYFARQVHTLDAFMQQGVWNRIMTDGAAGKTLGIIGFGEIGQALAGRAAAFGMHILYHCRTPKAELPYTFAPLDTVLTQSDYIVLALPLTAETRHLMDAGALAKMKKDAVLINVARAGIVDSGALRKAVESGHLRGAAVDVFESEPCTDSVLRGVNGILLTPHTAPFTKSNFIRMNDRAAQNVIDFFNSTIDKKYLV